MIFDVGEVQEYSSFLPRNLFVSSDYFKMDCTKKVSIERAIHMSLDEYIRESGLYKSPMLNHHRPQQHRIITEDVDLDIEDLKQEVTSDIDGDLDLRNKLSIKEVPNVISTPKVNSQQWRLLHPNNIQNRPAGMPPLVTKEKSAEDIFLSVIQKNKGNNGYNRRRWRNRRQKQFNEADKNNNRQQHQCNGQNQRQKQQQQHQQNNANNNRQYLNKISSGRVERRNVNDPWNGRNNCLNGVPHSFPMDLRVEATTSRNFERPLQLVEEQCQPQKQQQNVTNSGNLLPLGTSQNSLIGALPALSPSNILDSFGGIKLEFMPLIAGKLLEAIQAPKAIAPKYNMKIQKEIHDIQGKSMVYKCPGGEVLSSDGPGLNCRMTPASTGISLNQRFA